MESKVFEVAFSIQALKSLEQIYEYGVETFSSNAATLFIEELISEIETLNINYLMHPECIYLVTASKKYRTLIYGSYNVIYRISPDKVEVLNIIHSSRSTATIKTARKIKT